MSSPPSTDPYVGRILGPYRVESPIGSGASGQVYRATHRHLDRVVALKILVPPADTPEAALKRFKREAQAAARLQDPNVASIFDFGTEGEVSYIAQELVPGRSLGEVLKDQTKLSMTQALDVGVAIASGLAAIHKAGLIHRDLKPANVVLAEDGSAKIVDFGLVRIIDESFRLTKPGAIMGTPLYMAPEQILSEEVGSAADVYGLGCVLTHFFTGRPPHENGLKNLRAFLMRRTLEPALDVRAQRPNLSEELAKVINAALARDPAARPTARDMQAALLAARRLHRIDPVPDAETKKQPAALLHPSAPGQTSQPTPAETKPPTRTRRDPSSAAAPAPEYSARRTSSPSNRALEPWLTRHPWLAGAGMAGAGLSFLLVAVMIKVPQASAPALSTVPADNATGAEPKIPEPKIPEPKIPEPKIPEPKIPEPPQPKSVVDVLGEALRLTKALRLDEAEASLGAVSGALAEVKAARDLIEVLRGLNGLTPFAGDIQDPHLLTRAPRTRALIETWEPALSAYVKARTAAERRNALGIVLHFGRYRLIRRRQGLSGEEPAAFLLPERRSEFKLLEALATVASAGRRDPEGAAVALDRILSAPVAKTDLGARLTPWLEVWRRHLRRRAGE